MPSATMVLIKQFETKQTRTKYVVVEINFESKKILNKNVIAQNFCEY